MATFGDSLIDVDRLTHGDLASQLEAVRDLARLAELVVLGREYPGGINGADLETDDAALLHSILWPIAQIVDAARETVKEQKPEDATAPAETGPET